MFIVNKEEIQGEVKKINEYLNRCTWMDFTLYQSHFGKVELYGAIDQTYNNYVDNYAIKIDFEQPYFVSSLFSWQTDISKSFIQLVCGEEEAEFNIKYQIEMGNYFFRINAEGFDKPPIFIVAKKLVCKILNEYPFPDKS